MRSRFDLFYFDGLARQDTVIRISVTVVVDHAAALATTGGSIVGAGKNLRRTADEPPLELVLRTRWPGARFDWNGVEPLL